MPKVESRYFQLNRGQFLSARAQSDITMVAPSSIKLPLAHLIPNCESKTGYKVKATAGLGIGTKKQAIQGDTFDVPIMQPPLAEVIDSGNVVASTEVPLATIAVGVADRKGAPKPDISTPEAVKRMLLEAASVAYPDPPVARLSVAVLRARSSNSASANKCSLSLSLPEVTLAHWQWSPKARLKSAWPWSAKCATPALISSALSRWRFRSELHIWARIRDCERPQSCQGSPRLSLVVRSSGGLNIPRNAAGPLN